MCSLLYSGILGVAGAYSPAQILYMVPKQKAYVLQIDFIRKIIAFDGVEGQIGSVSLPALGSECLPDAGLGDDVLKPCGEAEACIAYVFLFFEGVGYR